MSYIQQCNTNLQFNTTYYSRVKSTTQGANNLLKRHYYYRLAELGQSKKVKQINNEVERLDSTLSLLPNINALRRSLVSIVRGQPKHASHLMNSEGRLTLRARKKGGGGGGGLQAYESRERYWVNLCVRC